MRIFEYLCSEEVLRSTLCTIPLKKELIFSSLQKEVD